MIRNLIIITFPFIFLCCSGTSKTTRPEIQPEIPSAALNERGIAAINPQYKKNYYKVLPYLLYNENGTFNEIQGDFYNVKFKESSNLNIMPGFWKIYGQYKNALVVLIALSDTSINPLEDVLVTVKSSKNGSLKKMELMGKNEIQEKQQRVLFVKELHIENQHDILNKISDDVITINIDGQVYEFLNPELKLN